MADEDEMTDEMDEELASRTRSSKPTRTRRTDEDELDEEELVEDDEEFGADRRRRRSVEDDDEEAEDDDCRTGLRAAPSTEDEDDDDDMLTPDDVEADLDTILKDRLVAAEETAARTTRTRSPRTAAIGDRLQPKRADEQLCSNCFLLVRNSAPGCPVGATTTARSSPEPPQAVDTDDPACRARRRRGAAVNWRTRRTPTSPTRRGGAALLAERPAVGDWDPASTNGRSGARRSDRRGRRRLPGAAVIAGSTAFVRQVYVTPEARELGFGDGMLDGGDRQARSAGCSGDRGRGAAWRPRDEEPLRACGHHRPQARRLERSIVSGQLGPCQSGARFSMNAVSPSFVSSEASTSAKAARSAAGGCRRCPSRRRARPRGWRRRPAALLQRSARRSSGLRLGVAGLDEAIDESES